MRKTVKRAFVMNRNNWACLLPFVLCLLFLPAFIYSDDGKLGNIRKETKDSGSKRNPPKSDSSSSSSSSKRDNSSCDDTSSFLGEIFSPIIGYILISPYYVPHHFWDEGFSTPLYFHPYPYFNANQGYFSLDETENTRFWAIDLSPEFKVYKDEVYGYGLNLNIRANFRIELQADYNYLEEKLDNGSTDSLALGNVNLLFRFAQNPYLLMRSGIGMNMLIDTEDDFGFNFTYSADIYPIKPLFLSARIDLGGLGDATFIRFRATVGFIWKQFELNAGFEYYDIGDVSLEGGTLGFKVYF